jgi:nitroreductase
MSYDLFEIMRSTRSMRRLKPDPIPDDVLGQVLEAGTYAANGGNMQTWRFVVIRDAAIKAAAGAWYRKSWHEIVGPRYRSAVPAPGQSHEQFGRMLAAAEYLADHIHEAPVWIVPCAPGARNTGSSIFPAVQNILLACRALGLGCTLTTLHLVVRWGALQSSDIPSDGPGSPRSTALTVTAIASAIATATRSLCALIERRRRRYSPP